MLFVTCDVLLQALVADDAATVAASQLPDGTCRMCQLQISHWLRLDAQGDAVFSQEDGLARSITSNICQSLVAALKPPAAPEAPPAVDSAHHHRQHPSYPTPMLSEPSSWHPGYPVVPPVGMYRLVVSCACSHALQAGLTFTPLAPLSCLVIQASAQAACL